MAFARKGSIFPSQSKSGTNTLHPPNNGNKTGRSLSRPTSKNNLNSAYSNSSSSSSSNDEPFIQRSNPSINSVPLPAPASPTKERMRQMGFRADGVGGSHFKQKGDEETNIQVVVRVRGVAPGEPQPIQTVLSTSSPHCSSLSVAIEAPIVSSSSTISAATATSVQSSLVNEAPTGREKTYSFDHVFAPEADQGMVYQSVVVPVLNEVLSGYNCTVFAYGQTGTGKTHTMEGDLTSNMGTYSPEAGIIPRTLYRLFHTLEQTRDEYSVHASFVELYNEELRDLLSHDPPQPLGGGGPNSNGLRIYEDAKGKGVVIQGLEDTPMKDAEHGLALLRRGSQKRQIAATKCNESSSRSHSVFTLTINIKETTSKGEDVLRTGKLNLVDLAGSENIGRSGAENKRAREAGMINQSLLTLGRVINALVEKSTHVPYRESKLTRLLQESLGGRTKTCIIATVSSERSNLEETLSTLDYALRAKSIRNRPEVNQRMTRAALIKEYVHEIERLKGDLLASREKNGIYLSPESWTLMQDEHDAVKAQVEELRRNGEVAESKMISVKEQFEQNMQQLIKRENENKRIQAECKVKEEEVLAILAKIDQYQKAEAEERLLREAYMRSEKKLNSVASELQGVVDESVNDAVALQAKLDRKTRVEKKNREVIAECQASMASISNQLEARVSEFANIQKQFTTDVASQLQEFQHREESKLKGNREYVQQKLNDLQNVAKQTGDEAKQNKKALDGLVDDIRRKGEALVMAAEDRNEEVRQICQRLASKVVQSSKDAVGAVKQNLEEMTEIYLISLKNSRDVLNQDRKGLEDVQSMTQEAMQKEMSLVKKRNEQLESLLEEEKNKSNAMREKMIKNISHMLLAYTQERQESLQSAFDEIRKSNNSSEEQIDAYASCQSGKLEVLVESNRVAREAVKEKEKAAKAQKMKWESSMTQGNVQLEMELQSLSTEVCSGSQGALQDMSETMKDVHSNGVRMREIMEATRAAQEKQMMRLQSSVEEGYNTMDVELQSTLEDVQETCESVIESVQDQSTLQSNFYQESSIHLTSLRDTAKDYLLGKISVDVTTGNTPEKRSYNRISTQAQWTLVPTDRKKALRQEKKRKLTKEDNNGDSISMTFTDESDSNQGDMSDREGNAPTPYRRPHQVLGGEDNEEDAGDRTLTNKNSRPRAMAEIKKPSIRASTTGMSSSAPLRETNGNRLSLAVGSKAVASIGVKSKIRQPSGTATLHGPPLNKARQ